MKGWHQRAAESYLDWWTLAGVDTLASETPADWLGARTRRDVPHPPGEPATGLPGNDARTAALAGLTDSAPTPGTTAAESFDPVHLPRDLAEFRQWLAESPGVPGAAGIGRRVLPSGPPGAALMILADMPDQEDTISGQLFSGTPGRLLDAMLAAVGIHRDACYLASMAMTRIGAAAVPDADRDALVTLARHHLSLVAPTRLMLLGTRTVRWLIPDASPENGARKLFINQNGTMMDVVAVPQLRSMIERPAAKAQAWASLKHLRKGA